MSMSIDNAWNVDICAAILAEKPPQLPLREELNSLGFEVVLAAAGTAIRASKYESRAAVSKFRRTLAVKDLKKRRFFPKSHQRIRETLAQRKRIEHELALAHACSYETYDIQMRTVYPSSGSSMGSESLDTASSESVRMMSKSADNVWAMFHRRQRLKLKRKKQAQRNAGKVGKESDAAAEAVFPMDAAHDEMFADYLAPDYFEEQHQQNEQVMSWSTSEENASAFGSGRPQQLDGLLNSTTNTIPLNESSSVCYMDGEGVQQPQHGLLNNPSRHESSPNASLDSLNLGVLMAKEQQQQQQHTAIDGIPLDLAGAPSSVDDDILVLHSVSTGMLDGLEINYNMAAGNPIGSSNNNERIPKIPEESSNISYGKVAHLVGTLDHSFDSKFAKTTSEDFPTNVWLSDDDDDDYEEKKDDGMNFKNSFMIHLPHSNRPSTEQALLQPKSFEDIVDSFTMAATRMDESGDLQTNNSICSPKEKVTLHIPTVYHDFVDSPLIQPTQNSPIEPQQPTTLNVFERATAEIMRAAGLESPPSLIMNKTDDNAPDEKNPPGWMTSAKNVLESISSEVLKATGLDKNHEVENLQQSQSHIPENDHSFTDHIYGNEVSTLFSSLSLPDVPPGEIENILAASPELPQIRRHKDGRLPLHVLCDRMMLDRSSTTAKSLTNHLLDDIGSHRKLIQIVLDFYPDACLVKDKRQDLPVHLIARRLMEWEATWYEIVYQNAAKENDASGITSKAITKIYQTMSESIEMLLLPVVANGEYNERLCQSPGSMGTIIPLHIASIFTVSVKCLRLALEACPQGASIHCDLGILRTFIPDESLALELHDNLSTDFPKWEVETENTTEIGDPDDAAENSMHRSDLLFSYNPIEPYRLDKVRIRRLESRIQYDAAVVVGKSTKRLEHANERLWIWMCTFRERDSDRPTYANSVKRIVSVLPLQSLRLLISVKAEDGTLLIDSANDECLQVIQQRLERITGITTPSAGSIDDTSTPVKESSSVVIPKDIVGRLCRLVFNVPEMSYPTTFVILPYKLQRDSAGNLQLSIPEQKRATRDFAACLQNFTEIQSVLYVLDKKSRDHYGQSLFDPSMYDPPVARISLMEDFLVALYSAGNAYLYLIDDATGLPSISNSETKFPIVLDSPTDIVRKVLPLMISGMMQMRGEKAISKLTSVILDGAISIVPQSWIEAADVLIDHFEGHNGKFDDKISSLRAFRLNSSKKLRMTERPKNGVTQWNAELSVLRKLYEINDADTTVMSASLGTESHLDGSPSVVSQSDSTGNTSLERQENFMAEKLEIMACQRHREPDIVDMTRKMDELFEMQHQMHQNVTHVLTKVDSHSMSVCNEESYSDHRGSDSSIVIELDDISTDSKTSSATNFHSQTDAMSRYSILFEDFSVSPENAYDEASDQNDENVRVWNSIDSVWEEVTLQLQSRAEMFCEDTQILQLKVALAEQARKLSVLGKKVSLLKDDERRLGTKEAMIYDVTNIQDGDEVYATSDSLSQARNLVLRMGDLEERLMCDEIQIQHLSMGAFSVEHEGGTMVTRLHNQTRTMKDRLRPEIHRVEHAVDEESLAIPKTDHTPDLSLPSHSLPRELSGISWGSVSNLERQSQRSFLLYERDTSKVLPENGDHLNVVPEMSSHEMLNSMQPQHIPFREGFSGSDQWHPVKGNRHLPFKGDGFDESIAESDEAGGALVSHSRVSGGDPDGSYVDQDSMDENSACKLTVWERREKNSTNPTSSTSSPLDPDSRTSSVALVADVGIVATTVHAHASTFRLAENNNYLTSPKTVRFSPTEGNEYAHNDNTGSVSKRVASSALPPIPEMSSLRRGGNKRYISAYASSDSIVSSVFRPTDTISVNYQVPHRELSAISSDRSNASEVINANRVLEIEQLISKYTTEAQKLSDFGEI